MIALLESEQNVFLKADNGCIMLFLEGISQRSDRELLCSHHTAQYNLLAVSKVLLHEAIAAIACDDLNIGTSFISLYRDLQCHLGNSTFHSRAISSLLLVMLTSFFFFFFWYKVMQRPALFSLRRNTSSITKSRWRLWRDSFGSERERELIRFNSSNGSSLRLYSSIMQDLEAIRKKDIYS